MCGIGSASAMPHAMPDAWRRHLGIVLDGLRAEAASRIALDASLWRYDAPARPPKTSPGTSTRCSTAAPTIPKPPSRGDDRRVAAPRRRVRRGPRGQDGRARRRPASSPRCASWRRSRRSSAAPAPTRCSTSPATPPTRRAARCCRRSRRARPGSRPRCCSSSSSGRRSTTTRADELLAADGLDFARHHLRTARRYRPHLLSEPEEKILAEKALTGRNAWSRLFEEQASAITVELEEGAEPVSLEVALSRLFAPDRDVRRHAAESVTAALQPGLRTRAYILNTLLADKMVDDRLRNYPHWLASRNLANEASDESVEALIEAVRDALRAAAPLVPLKAKLLGIDQLADYDRMAAVTDGGGARRLAAGREHGARVLQRVLGRARRARAALLRRVVDRRARAPEQARRRVLRLHGAVGAPVRAPQLHARPAATC